MYNIRKKTIKKFMIALLSGVTLMGIGVTAGTVAINTQQTEVKADTWSYTMGHVEFDKSDGSISYRELVFNNININPGQSKTMNMPKYANMTPNYKTVTFTEAKNGNDITSSLDGKWILYVPIKSSAKKTTTAKGVSVVYKSQKLTKQVKLAPGHDFYNHIPGSKYTVKRVHYGTTYKGKTVTVNMQGIKKGAKTPYYRCYYKGKLIGWIYSTAVVNVAKYKTIHKTATVVASPKNDFYNHLTYSIYKTKRLHYGKTYRNKKVTINDQAIRVGTKTPYYRCYVNGKEIGWIYGSNLTKLN